MSIEERKNKREDNIRQKQYQLNSLLSEININDSILDNDILKLSQDLDKLIVAHYRNKKSN